MTRTMKWDDLNKPGPFELEFLGAEIQEELMAEALLPRELTQKELDELSKVERSVYRQWAVGQWLSWGPTQLVAFVLVMLLLLVALP